MVLKLHFLSSGEKKKLRTLYQIFKHTYLQCNNEVLRTSRDGLTVKVVARDSGRVQLSATATVHITGERLRLMLLWQRYV